MLERNSMTATAPITFQQSDSVGIITLNRPEKLNAMNREVFEGFLDYLDQCREPSIRSIVIRGEGRAFCAGDDIGTVQQRDESGLPIGGYGSEHPRETIRRASPYRVTTEIYRHPKPVIAAVHGYTLAMGCEVALASDFRIVAEGTTFGIVNIRTGGVGGVWLLEKYVGLGKAKEFILTGDYWDVDQAEQMGLVTRRVPREDLDATALAYAERFVDLPTKVVGYAKAAIHHSMNVDIEDGHEQMIFANSLAVRTEDRAEGRLSFVEKRKPRYTGR